MIQDQRVRGQPVARCAPGFLIQAGDTGAEGAVNRFVKGHADTKMQLASRYQETDIPKPLFAAPQLEELMISDEAAAVVDPD